MLKVMSTTTFTALAFVCFSIVLLAILRCVECTEEPQFEARYPDPSDPEHNSTTWTEEEARLYLDDLQRNVTNVLDMLLNETRYNKRLRPGYGQGFPTVIKTNIYIKSMGPVSETDMEFSMDCYFRQKWQDDRLTWNETTLTNLQGKDIDQISISILALKRMWRPDTYFFNGKRSYIHDITVPNKLLRINKHGEIYYSMRLTIKANCPMRLAKFPMDTQACPLQIGSFGYPANDVKYVWMDGNDDSITTVENMELSQFDLVKILATNETIRRDAGVEFSHLTGRFILRRRTGYFLIQTYVPCILIVVMSWVSFWINKEASPARVGLGITTILTMTTLSFSGRGSVSKAATTTALDWFQIICFAYVFASLVEYAGVNFVDSWQTKEEEKKRKKDIPSGGIPTPVRRRCSGVTTPPDHTPIHQTNEIDEMESLTCSPHHALDGIAVAAVTLASTQVTGLSADEVTTTDEDGERDDEDGDTKCSCGRLTWRCRVRCEARSSSSHPSQGFGRSKWKSKTKKDESRLDNLSRIIFPLSFAIMNLFYWFSYLYYMPELTE